MNFMRLLFILVIAVLCASCETWAQDRYGGEAQGVGMVTRSYSDESRKNWEGTGPRPLRTAVWYPAGPGGRTETIFLGSAGKQAFVPVTILRDADISLKSDRYPLIIMSHGTGGSAMMMSWLGRYLAGQGYIVAAVNHHGNTAAESRYTPQGFLLYWERPKDLTAVLDKLLADSVFGARIDRNRIGAAGFSLGGFTVMSIAGGIFSQTEYEDFCRSSRRDFTCEPQREFPEAREKLEALKKSDPIVQESLRHAGDSCRDGKIKGVFVIAPALGSGFTPTGLSGIKIPVHIVIGQADSVAPLATNAKRYADLTPGAKLTVLPGGVGHYTFLGECTSTGKKFVAFCQDAEGVDRAAVHAEVSKLALRFFEQVWAMK